MSKSNNSNFKGVPTNVYDDCPALMSDGRFLTSYLPNCELKYYNSNIAQSFIRDNKLFFKEII